MSPDRVPEVRVLTSPADVAAARAEGDAYWPQVAATLGPDYLDALGRSPVSYSTLDRIANDRRRLLPLLRDLAATGGAPAAAACIALAWFGEPEYVGCLRERLATETATTLGQCLELIGKSDSVVRDLPGIDVLAPRILQIAQTRDHADQPAAMRAAFALGLTFGGPEVVEELLQKATGKSYEDWWIGHALGLLARGGGEAALLAAQALLRPPFLDAQNVRRAGLSRDARVADNLEQVLGSGVKKDIQGAVLLAFAYVQGQAAVPRLLEALDDPELSQSAATGLGIAAEGTRDETIVAALTLAAAGARSVDDHAMAMARIGGALAMRTLAGLAKRANVYAGTYAGWRARGITATAALQRFVDANVIPRMPTDAELRAAAGSDYAWEPNDVWLLWHFVRQSRRYVELTSEDGSQEVARHTLVLERLAGATGGQVEVTHASQRTGPADARLERELVVQFVWGDRAYRVKALAFNRNYNLVALRLLLNEALRDRGAPERFVRREGHDYDQWIFGDERAIEAACDDLTIPHGDDRKWRVKWHDALEALFREAGGSGAAPQTDGVAFQIVSPTGAAPTDPRPAVHDCVTRALGRSLQIDVEAGAAWTTLWVHIPRELVTAHGAEAIEALFESICETAEAHLARTLFAGEWALIRDGELAGAIDALDWLQYFGPRFGDWLGKRKSRLLSARRTPRGGQMVKLQMDPLAPSWVARQDAGRDLYLQLRKLPAPAEAEVDPAVRLKAVQPPEPVQWQPEQRAAMLRSRGQTWKAIEGGMADARLFDRFRHRYLAGELEATLLDRLATWLPHYGVEATTAAFRAVARRHGDHPAAGALVAAALEGCVKLVSWGGDARPVKDRELLAEHLIDLTDPTVALFARDAYEPDVVGGMMMLTAIQVSTCQCERCRQTKERLG